MPIRRKSKSKTSEDQIINRGEYHIPVAVVLDVSWKDEEDYKQVVSQAVIEFLDAAKENSFASGRLDICLIACNNRGRYLILFARQFFWTSRLWTASIKKGNAPLTLLSRRLSSKLNR